MHVARLDHYMVACITCMRGLMQTVICASPRRARITCLTVGGRTRRVPAFKCVFEMNNSSACRRQLEAIRLTVTVTVTITVTATVTVTVRFPVF